MERDYVCGPGWRSEIFLAYRLECQSISKDPTFGNELEMWYLHFVSTIFLLSFFHCLQIFLMDMEKICKWLFIGAHCNASMHYYFLEGNCIIFFSSENKIEINVLFD